MTTGLSQVLTELGTGFGTSAIDKAATQNHGHAFNRLVSNTM